MQNNKQPVYNFLAIIILLIIIFALFSAWDFVFILGFFVTWFIVSKSLINHLSKKNLHFLVKFPAGALVGFVAGILLLSVGFGTDLISSPKVNSVAVTSAEPESSEISTTMPSKIDETTPLEPLKKMPRDFILGFLVESSKDFLLMHQELAEAKENYKYNHLGFYNWQKPWSARIDRINDSLGKLKPKLLASAIDDDEYQLIMDTLVAYGNLSLSRVNYNGALIAIMREGDETKFRQADKYFEKYFIHIMPTFKEIAKN